MNNNYNLISSSEMSEFNKYFIIFRLNQKSYAINIKNVIEIINMPEIDVSGQVPENIIGMFNYKGLMIKVIDLCDFLNEKRENFSVNNKLIIVTVEGNCYALHAKYVDDILIFDNNSVQNVPYELENSIITQICKLDSETISIIDMNVLDKLVSSKNSKVGNFNYLSLFPDDEKSKQILKLRTEQKLKFQENLSFPQRMTLVHQYILFTLDNYNYFLDLKYVKEFVTLKRQKITPLPYTQDYIKGLINIKGNFLVVIDLKKFLNHDCTNSVGNKLIVVQGKNYNVAFLVDDIKYIKNLQDIKKSISNNYNSPYIYSEFIEEEVLYSILNIEKILNDEQIYINVV